MSTSTAKAAPEKKANKTVKNPTSEQADSVQRQSSAKTCYSPEICYRRESI